MRLLTIGFTRHGARAFFEKLRASGAGKIVDVRLNNTSQLSGFAKRDDLGYFLEQVCGMGYEDNKLLAPTDELLAGYKKEKRSWQQYERDFLDLMAERRIDQVVTPEQLENACLLCSEHSPDHCHRRLVAEYLRAHWKIPVQISHIT